MSFPSEFWWGTAASSTQAEGAAPASDWYALERAGRVPPTGTGNDFGTRYAEDFEMYAEYGLRNHRLSIEWARIEPEEGRRDDAAIEHYREVLTAARAAGVNPWVCLHHFTLPGWFTEVGEGGFVDERARSYFWPRHVAFCAETFGDLVYGWKPINEPAAYSSIYRTGGRSPASLDWGKVFDTLGGVLLAQRDAWRELRGGGQPVATIHNLSPVFPVGQTVQTTNVVRRARRGHLERVDARRPRRSARAPGTHVARDPGPAGSVRSRRLLVLLRDRYRQRRPADAVPRERARRIDGIRAVERRARHRVCASCTMTCPAGHCSSASTASAPTTTSFGATSCASR